MFPFPCGTDSRKRAFYRGPTKPHGDFTVQCAAIGLTRFKKHEASWASPIIPPPQRPRRRVYASIFPWPHGVGSHKCTNRDAISPHGVPQTRYNNVTNVAPPITPPATRCTHASVFQWHGFTQTRLPPRPRKTARRCHGDQTTGHVPPGYSIFLYGRGSGQPQVVPTWPPLRHALF